MKTINKSTHMLRESVIKMKVIKQQVSLEVDNITGKEKKPCYIKHSVLFPNNIRCIICGPSNCGKTNVMMSLLLHQNGLKFQNVYLYSKTSYQSKYIFLKEIFTSVPEVNYFVYNSDEDVIHPNDALPNSIIIFDDVINEKQTNIRNYFTMGRHRGIDCFYLSQTYSKIPKQLLRDNVNFLIIFQQDIVNLKHIYDEHVSSDMNWIKFKDLCSEIWVKPNDFLIINKDSELNKGRYRHLFDKYITFD